MGGGIVWKDGGIGVYEETHRKMVLFGVILSVVSMSLVSHFVKKELYKVDKRKMMLFRQPPRDIYVGPQIGMNPELVQGSPNSKF